MKKVDFKYVLIEKTSKDIKFISDTLTIEEFIEDMRHYFDYHPAGFRPYRINVGDKFLNSTSNNIMFYNNITVTFEHEGKIWKETYYIDMIPYINTLEKNIKTDMHWDIKKNSELSIKINKPNCTE